MNEPVRIVANWLADAGTGAQAELANVPLGGDPAPTAIAAVLDETRHAIIAQGRIPEGQTTPFLFVWQLTDLQWREENQGKQDGEGIEIGIAYIDRDSNAERALRDSGYVLRAVKRSLNRLHRNAAEASRTLNSVILRNGALALRAGRPELELEQAYISRAVAVTYTVRDLSP